jgi:pimeloyl-ACP methyl ester carboxylesterase
MDRVTIDGTTIRVHRQGEGRPLVYLHSGSGEVGAIPFFAQLEARGFAITAPEFPGCGSSDPNPQIRTIEDAVFFLRRTLDELQVDEAILCGASLGGWLAAELAVWFPERVSGLVLVNAVGLYLPDAPILDIFLTDMAELMTAANPHSNDIFSPLMAGLEGEFSQESLVAMMMKGQQVASQLGWNPYMHDPRLEPRLAGIKARTLVVWGADDGIVPVRHGERYAERIADAKLALVEKAGHNPVLEKPSEVAGLVGDFFS